MKNLMKYQISMNNIKEPQVYWANINFSLKKSHESYQEFIGGDVYAFVESADASDALEKMKTELASYKLKAKYFQYILPYVDVDWGEEKIQSYYDGLVSKASKNNTVILDEMYCDERFVKDI